MKNKIFDKYLASSKIIDFDNSNVKEKANELAQGRKDLKDIARNCFLYVRDQIKHSYDYQLNPVTCKASDVLTHKTGYCYHKAQEIERLIERLVGRAFFSL